MASHELSSDSDYSNGDMRYQSKRVPEHASNKVEHLAATLQDTNKNLRAMDKMLEDYRDVGSKHDHKVDRLRDDLAKTKDRLREEKMRSRDSRSAYTLHHSDPDEEYSERRRSRRGPTSPLRDYRAVSDHEGHSPSSRHQPSRSGAIRFFDDMDGHQVHQGLRDVTSHQIRIGDDLDREIDRRNHWESHSKRTFMELKDALKKPESTMTSVDKRLQNIQDELRNERLQLKKEHQEVGKLSAELKKSPIRFRSPKIEELRKQLARSDEEKAKLRSHMDQQDDEVKNRMRKLAYDDRERTMHEQERQRLENEVRDLRAQLGKSATVVGEFSETRRELDKSEKQRAQLSDHIEVLTHNVEQHEKQTAKAITQLQLMTDKYDQAELARQHLTSQLDDHLYKLKDMTKVAEGHAAELRATQKQLKDSEARKEEIKARAHETVRQWKQKCKKLERDTDRYKHSAEQASARLEQLIKELQNTKNTNNTTGQQLELIKREFSEILAVRAQQDEQVRIKDVQVNELKSIKMDLENQLRDCKVVIERLEYELHSAREKFGSCLEDKNKFEDQVASLENSHHMIQAQLQQMQREISEANHVKVDLSSQLAEAANERVEMKKALTEAMKNEARYREEVQVLLHRCRDEKDLYTKRVDSMTAELEAMKGHETQRLQDISRRYKKEKAESDAEKHAMKIEMQEEKSSVKMLKKQQEKLKQEIDRLNRELAIKEDECSQLSQQYHQIREDLLTKSLLTEDGLSRAKEVELELLDTREGLRKSLKEFESVCYSIASEVDSLVDIATLDSIQTYRTMAMNKALASEPRQCVVEIRSKLEWLKAEFRERREKEQWLKANMKDVAINSEKDRQFLLTEIERQNDVLDQITIAKLTDSDSNSKQDVKEENKKNKDIDNKESSQSPKHKAAIQERERINERFARLQETMSSLKNELVNTTLFKSTDQYPMSSTPKPHEVRSPKSLRKVTFEDSPGRRSRTPPSSPGNLRNSNLKKTPSPLKLTDQEFAERFMPKSPPGFDSSYIM